MNSFTVKYPDVDVELVGQDGNAFVILGLVSKAMRRSGLTSEQISEYREEAMSGNYDQLLETTMRYVNVS